MNPTTLGDILGTTASTRGREFMCAGGAGTGSGAVRVYNDNAASLIGQAPGTNFTTTDKYVVTFANAAATNRCETNINGLNDQIVTTALNYAAGTFTNVVGATLSTTNVRNYNSYIYEIIVFNSELTNQNRVDITNYLMNKWGITRFPTPNTRFPFYRAPFMRLFNPIDIPTCSLWLDAADNTTLTSNISGYVTQWRDKSGNNYHATGFGNTALQTLGRYRGIVFDNATTYFYASNATAMNNTSNLSVIALGTFTTPPTANVNWLRMVSFGDPDFNANSNIVALLRYANTDSITIERSGTPSSGTAITLGSPFIASSINANTNINLFVNGTAGYSTSFATKGAFNYNLYNIGRFSGSGVGTAGNFVWSGSIGEVIAYNRYLNKYERELLEGYLAHKWGLIGNLPATHTYKAVVPTTTIFNPLVINAFCSLWLDSRDLSTLTLSGSSVSRWADKSGNGYSFSQSDGSKQPVHSSAGVRFEGQAVLSQLGTNVPQIRNATALTMIFVGTRLSGGPGSPQFMTFWFANEGPTVVGATTQKFYIHGTSGGNVTVAWNAHFSLTSTNSVTPGTSAVYGATLASTGNATNINGTLTTTTGAALNVASTDALMTLGFAGNTNCVLSEVLFFSSALPTSDRQLIEGYLAWKWGLQASLPSTHP